MRRIRIWTPSQKQVRRAAAIAPTECRTTSTGRQLSSTASSLLTKTYQMPSASHALFHGSESAISLYLIPPNRYVQLQPTAQFLDIHLSIQEIRLDVDALTDLEISIPQQLEVHFQFLCHSSLLIFRYRRTLKYIPRLSSHNRRCKHTKSMNSSIS